MLTRTTPLLDLGIPNLPAVLEQAFALVAWQEHAVPPETLPRTINELSERSGLDLDTVIARLQEIQTMVMDIEISPEELHERLASGDAKPILLDVREEWEYAICHLEGSLLLANADFPSLLNHLKTGVAVVTICHHGVRSYSAALYLKEQGVMNVQSLAGGVERWAKTIDPDMASY